MNKLCFSTFVFGSYQKYIPYYIYSIVKTYPDAVVKVIVDGELETGLKKSIAILRSNGFSNFEIFPLGSEMYKDLKNYKITGGVKKLLRWLQPVEHFKEFDYVYFGDVDILILQEEISLLDFHKKQLEQFHLSFSNKVRVDPSGRPTNRLTGLHFVEVEPYYKAVQPIIEQIHSDSSYRKEFFEGLNRDENLLYKLNKTAFHFDDEKLIHAQRPWHGIHLGIVRGKKAWNKETLLENSSLGIEVIKSQLQGFLKDPVFKQIQAQVFVIELYDVLKYLQIKNNFYWQWKARIFEFKTQIHRLKKKVKGKLNV